MVASVILVGYLVLRYYWQRRNWARLLVLFTSILAIVNLLIVSVLFVIDRLFSSSILYHAVIVANAALGAFLRYWHNKKDVRAWFRKSEPDPRSTALNKKGYSPFLPDRIMLDCEISSHPLFFASFVAA